MMNVGYTNVNDAFDISKICILDPPQYFSHLMSLVQQIPKIL